MAAPMKRVIFQLERLAISHVVQGISSRTLHTQNYPLAFRVSAIVCGEPLKKRKKMDPAIQIAREKKREKKIEKQIKRLEKFGRKLKPIEEIAGDTKLRKDAEIRRREVPPLSFDDAEERALIQKDWTRYKSQQYKAECWVIQTAKASMERALEELRNESEELYQKAIEVDESLIPFKKTGPVDTPPIKDYDSPDGELMDTTKTY